MNYYIRLNSDGFYDQNYKYSKNVSKLWGEVSNIFNNYHLETFALNRREYIGYKISVDASDAILFFNKRIQKVNTDDYYSEPDFYIKISLLTIDDGEMISIGGARSLNIINRFLQDLFISMNIAFPSSFNLWYAVFYEHIDSYDVVAYAPFYSARALSRALELNINWQYAAIKKIAFAKVWTWINSISIPGVGIATNPAQKACFVLLNLSKTPEFNIENSIALSRVFEIILTDSNQGVNKIVKERLELLFGKPKENKKWFSQFYQIRSRVVHGDLPVTRNSNEFRFQNEDFLAEFEKTYYQAFIMFISLLQKMVLNDCSGFVFSQKIKPLKHT